MTFWEFLLDLLPYTIIIPAILLCYAPAKNRFRYDRSKTVTLIVGFAVSLCVLAGLSTTLVFKDWSIMYTVSLLLLFIVYHKSLLLHISQSVSIFVLVCTFNSFINNYAIIFDALRHPTGKLADFSLEAYLFQAGLSILFCILASYPMARYGSYLVDNLQQPRIWWISAVVSSLFYIFNQRMVIHRYDTLHTNSVGIAYITVMIMMFFLLILLCIIFYYIVNALIEKARTEDNNRIMSMQERHYEALQQYIDSDSRARHDFRQAIYTLSEFSSKKDYESIDDYLHKYIETLPQKETVDYCSNSALNALINHYARMASARDIEFHAKVMLPTDLNIRANDLCSIVGNILENAIKACSDPDLDKRIIRLVISSEQGNELYIAVSNSYGGKLLKKGDRYLSNHKGGSGIGLVSITTTAEHYGGSARFSNDDRMFYSDVMLVNREG